MGTLGKVALRLRQSALFFAFGGAPLGGRDAAPGRRAGRAIEELRDVVRGLAGSVSSLEAQVQRLSGERDELSERVGATEAVNPQQAAMLAELQRAAHEDIQKQKPDDIEADDPPKHVEAGRGRRLQQARAPTVGAPCTSSSGTPPSTAATASSGAALSAAAASTGGPGRRAPTSTPASPP